MYRFLFLFSMISSSRTIFWEGLSFFYHAAFAPLPKTSLLCGSISGFSIMHHVAICLFFHIHPLCLDYCSIIVSLETGNVSHQTLFIFSIDCSWFTMVQVMALWLYNRVLNCKYQWWGYMPPFCVHFVMVLNKRCKTSSCFIIQALSWIISPKYKLMQVFWTQFLTGPNIIWQHWLCFIGVGAPSWGVATISQPPPTHQCYNFTVHV